MPRKMETSGTRGRSSQGAAGAPALTILVVDHDRDELAATKKVLTGTGYSVKDASTFEEGRRLMAVEPPDVLIADVRLGAFNGLHLLVISRHDRPEMAAIITHAYSDPVLEAEANHHGAAYLVKSIRLSVLLSTISEVLLRRAPRSSGRVRRWPLPVASCRTRRRNACLLSLRVIGLLPSAFPWSEKLRGRIGHMALLVSARSDTQKCQH